MVEHLLCKQGVTGSSPVSSTIRHYSAEKRVQVCNPSEVIVHEVRTPSVKFAEVRITALSVFLHGDYGVKVSISDCGSLGVGSSPTNHPKKTSNFSKIKHIYIRNTVRIC